MSGVIDADGQQWERCNIDGTWTRIQDLLYEEPSDEYPHGRDVGPCCAHLAGKLRPGNAVTISIPKDYYGDCGRCLKNPGRHKVWTQFDHPLEAKPEFNLPEVEGAWGYICDACKAKDDAKEAQT